MKLFLADQLSEGSAAAALSMPESIKSQHFVLKSV